jgi:hypothetical protein
VIISVTIEAMRLLVDPPHSLSSLFLPPFRSKIELHFLNVSLSIVLSSLVSTSYIPRPGIHSTPSKHIVEVVTIVKCL